MQYLRSHSRSGPTLYLRVSTSLNVAPWPPHCLTPVVSLRGSVALLCGPRSSSYSRLWQKFPGPGHSSPFGPQLNRGDRVRSQITFPLSKPSLLVPASSERPTSRSGPYSAQSRWLSLASQPPAWCPSPRGRGWGQLAGPRGQCKKPPGYAPGAGQSSPALPRPLEAWGGTG